MDVSTVSKTEKQQYEKGIFEVPFVGLKYFKEFFSYPNIPNAIINTLGMGLLNITIGFVIPIIFALLLNELMGTKFKRIVQTVSYLPHFISWVILGGFLISWTCESGLINQIFMGLGLRNEPLILMLTFFRQISQELEEAAK